MRTEHMNKNRHEQSLQYALKVLKSSIFSPYIKKIYLYGSYARKEQNYQSDVDLLIFITESTPTQMIAKMRHAVISEDYTLPEVELKFTKSDRFSSSYQFNKNIERDAILLWEK